MKRIFASLHTFLHCKCSRVLWVRSPFPGILQITCDKFGVLDCFASASSDLFCLVSRVALWCGCLAGDTPGRCTEIAPCLGRKWWHAHLLQKCFPNIPPSRSGLGTARVCASGPTSDLSNRAVGAARLGNYASAYSGLSAANPLSIHVFSVAHIVNVARGLV